MKDRQPIPLLSDLELREREIAAQHGIDYDRADRVWLRREALKVVADEPAWRPSDGGGE